VNRDSVLELPRPFSSPSDGSDVFTALVEDANLLRLGFENGNVPLTGDGNRADTAEHFRAATIQGPDA
jgi:hypothetical protein